MVHDDSIVLEDNEENSDRKYDVINSFTYEFTLENSQNLDKTSNHLLSISYNNRQKMFILLDPLGLVTWEWKKIYNSTQRVFSYPDFEYKHIIDVIYCKNHNCYFALKGDFTLVVLNSNFLEICSVGDNKRSVQCMSYNTITDELITSGLDGVKVYCLKSSSEKQRKTTAESLSSVVLILKKEMKWNQNIWIRRIEVDTVNNHLYCCTRTDLCIYDFNGSLIRVYEHCHRLAITTCVYSPSAKVVLTGSEDCEIKVWSLAGGKIDTFRGHTNCVTNLVLNPYNSNLFISSSKDGSIKMWSLDVMQQIYDLNTFGEPILWLGFTEDKLLYAASTAKIQIWSLNNFIDFWALSRDTVNKMQLSHSTGKRTRVIAANNDNSIRIFDRNTAKCITTILPIPKPDTVIFHSIVYTRNKNILYLLLEENKIWLYFTKTHPATHICVWDTSKIQENKLTVNNTDKKTCIQPPKLIQLSTQDLLLKHRAIEYSLLMSESTEVCTSIGILESPVIFYNEEGACSPVVKTFLLLGLQNGKIIFCDALIEYKKYFIFNCNKDPIVTMYQDHYYHKFVTVVKQSSAFLVQYWSLPELELQKEFFCSNLMTCFARIDDYAMIGLSDGSIDLNDVKAITDSTVKFHTLTDSSYEIIVNNNNRKFEHKEKVETVDACQNLKLFCSSSLDGSIKIWSNQKNLISEIYLDSTLSYACFLNQNGDLFISWQRNLFFIYLKKVVPKKFLRKVDEDSQLMVSDDSSVIEDPSFKTSNYIDLGEKETLESYLYPFKLKFSTEGWSNVETKTTKLQEAKENLSVRSDTNSGISTIPSSLFSTPRNVDGFLPNVDLTLNSNVKRKDIKTYLIEIFSKSLKKRNSYEWKFPSFGKSPMSTPKSSSRPCSSESAKKEEKQIEVISKTIDQATDPILTTEIESKVPETFKKRVKKKDDSEEMERKLRERMPTEYQSGLKNAKIDSRTLVNLSPTSKSSRLISRNDNFIKPTSPEKMETRNIIKKPAVKPTKPQKKLTILTVKDIKLAPTSRQPSLASEEDFEVKKFRRKKLTSATSSGVKVLKKKKIDRDRKPGDKFADESSEEREYEDEGEVETLMNSEAKQNANNLKKSQINKKKFLLPPLEEVRDLKSDLRNIESVEPEDSGRSQVSKKAFGRSNNGTDLSNRFSSNSDCWGQSQNKSNEILKPKFKKIVYSEAELKQINTLFGFFYGIGGPPKRIRSANYAAPLQTELPKVVEIETVKPLENKVVKNEQNMTNDVKIVEKKNESNKNVLNYFDSLIENFEKKRNQFNDRVRSAKIRRENLQEESLRKWSASIEKKSVKKPNESNSNNKQSFPYSRPNSINLIDITYGERSLLNRETKSATTSRRKLSNKRPKSVTFTDEVNDGNDEEKLYQSEFETDYEMKPDEDSVFEQTPYLISAIEMEEILEAAAAKAIERSRSKSSVTTIPTVYFNQIQNIQHKVPTQKQPNDNIQESLERYFETSATDTSDNELNSESDYVSASQQFGRSSYLSSNTKLSGKITSSTLTFDSQITKQQNSSIKSMRINSCTVDYRRGSALKKNVNDEFESMSSYRISLKSVTSNSTKSNGKRRIYYNKNETSNVPTRCSKHSQHTQKDEIKRLKSETEDDEYYESSIYSKYRLINSSPDGLHRYKHMPPRSPSSIPSKCRTYKLKKYPELKLKYKLPGYPESYLLPIRFPELHTKIVGELLKFKKKRHLNRSLNRRH